MVAEFIQTLMIHNFIDINEQKLHALNKPQELPVKTTTINKY